MKKVGEKDLANRRISSHGSITLFTGVVLLPILFFLLTISLDLVQLFSDRSEAQRLIDEAALHGYRFLPFQEQAKRAVEGYLSELNRLEGDIKTLVKPDSIEISYQGIAPFAFASFVGRKTGIPYHLRTRVRGTIVHAALVVDASTRLAPRDNEEPWGNESEWPSALLFNHFNPFGPQYLPRQLTQQCFNPLFAGLKRSVLRLFDYLSSFNKNSISVAFYPGTLSSIDVIKDARRPGRALSNPLLGYFNIANGSNSKNAYCLAAVEEESLESPYQMPSVTGLGVINTGSVVAFTDPTTHHVLEASLGEVSVREAIWTRAVRSGDVSIRRIFSAMSETLALAGELNDYESGNQLAQKPIKVGVIFASQLPMDGIEIFPAANVKQVLRTEIERYLRLLTDGARSASSRSTRLGAVYYVLLGSPQTPVSAESVTELQSFFAEVLQELEAVNSLAIRVVYSQDADELASGIIRSLVLENNTAVIDG